MKYVVVIVAIIGVFGLHGMEGDDVALELRAMEAGNAGPVQRADQIKSHFGVVLQLHTKTTGEEDFLENQLAELDEKDFQKLLAKKTKRGGRGGLFGWGSNNDSQELVFFMTELSRLRLENERMARENEELMRERYERWKNCSSWVMGTLMTFCTGTTIATGLLGGKLSEFMAEPTNSATVANLFNATLGS